MSRGVACKSGSPAFESGITNGAAWYPVKASKNFICRYPSLTETITLSIADRWHARLQLRVVGLHGGDTGSVLLQVSAIARAEEVLGRQSVVADQVFGGGASRCPRICHGSERRATEPGFDEG